MVINIYWQVLKMGINHYFEELKKYSKKIDYENNKEELISNYEIKKDEYNYGVVMTIINNKYEVYSYVIDDKKNIIVNNLLLKIIDDKKQAEEYYKNLAKSLNDNDIDYLLKECKRRV